MCICLIHIRFNNENLLEGKLFHKIQTCQKRYHYALCCGDDWNFAVSRFELIVDSKISNELDFLAHNLM